MGPATVAALQRHLPGLAADPSGILIAATDADIAGRRYAERLEGLAAEAGVRFDAILPPHNLNDWNHYLRSRIRAPYPPIPSPPSPLLLPPPHSLFPLQGRNQP